MQYNNQESLLSLVRLGIGNSVSYPHEDYNWKAIHALAVQHGLNAILVDGIERLPVDKRPSKETLLEWIGEILQGYELRSESYQITIAELAGFYNNHGLKMMVLKGYACGLNWPKPEHRPCGDIDIWLFGKFKQADALLAKEKGIKVDNSHHHHSVFFWRDFMVENHYDFINVHHHKSNVDLEKIFKELGKDDTHFIKVRGETVYVPSPDLHTLFLLKHMMNDFTSFSVSLRQILDWAFHVKKYSKEIDWNSLLGVIEKYHMTDFFNIINAICVEDLGFASAIFPSVQFNPALKEKVINDIFYPAFSVQEPPSLFPRLSYKMKRWLGNGWKHKLCYSESRWSAFWSGVWGHLLKPKSL